MSAAVPLRDLLIRPAPPGAVTTTAPATLAVLCAEPDAAVTGPALALAAGARTVVLCAWPRAVVTPGPATLATRRLAARLSARDLPATARGRLVHITLPADPDVARTTAERTLAAGGAAPVVLLVAGPRPPAFDPLLSTLDHLILAPHHDAPPGLDTLALTTTAHLDRPTSILRLPPPSPTTRLLTTTGLLLPPSLHSATHTALDHGDV